MERHQLWLEAIITVKFDLEEGQLPDLIIPEGYGTEKDRKAISLSSFPDTSSFNMEGQIVYSFYLRKETKEGRPDLVHCFACYMQKKDESNARGFSQKSLVFLTKIKLYSFFKRLFSDVAKAYFETNSDSLLHEVYDTMNNKWPQPDHIPDIHDVELLGKRYQIKSEKDVSYKHRFCNDPGLWPEDISRSSSVSSKKSEDNDSKSIESTPERYSEDKPLLVGSPRKLSGKLGILDDFKQINLFSLLGKQPICLVVKLWEIMMLNESLLIVADSPIICSELVFALQSITTPFQTTHEVYPYFTVFDNDMKLIQESHTKSRDGIIIGATNPFFLKNFEEFPNILRLDKDHEESILKKNLFMKTIKTSSFLKSTVLKRAKGESIVKKWLTKDLSAEAADINNAMVRKKLEKLSFGIAGLISSYFSNQKNDLKFFDGAQFLKTIREAGAQELSEYFGGKPELVKFMTDFVCTRNFQVYVQRYFNVHFGPPKQTPK